MVPETEARKQAAKLFTFKGWSVEEIAAELSLDPEQVTQWRRQFSWDEKLMKYLNNQERLKNYLGALKAKLAREAFKHLESKRISDLATLLKADASLAKVNPDRGKEKQLSRREIGRLMREEYGIDVNGKEDSSPLSKELA